MQLCIGLLQQRQPNFIFVGAPGKVESLASGLTVPAVPTTLLSRGIIRIHEVEVVVGAEKQVVVDHNWHVLAVTEEDEAVYARLLVTLSRRISLISMRAASPENNLSFFLSPSFSSSSRFLFQKKKKGARKRVKED
jgi:hypothetical protein